MIRNRILSKRSIQFFSLSGLPVFEQDGFKTHIEKIYLEDSA